MRGSISLHLFHSVHLVLKEGCELNLGGASDAGVADPEHAASSNVGPVNVGMGE